MICDKEKFGWLYSKWYILMLWIIVISAAIGLLYNYFNGQELTLMSIMLPSFLHTAFLWGGSMSIVAFSWKTFPWESHPLKHIVMETLLIALLLTLFIFVMGLLYAHNEQVCFRDALRFNSADIVFTVLITFLIVTLHEAAFFYRQWKLNFSKSISLEKDNLQAQYNALKAQVNPHFLFNSLNSLISMLDEHPVAEKYVQDLSDYLRYVLISNTRETVSLREELENSEKYIHLQKQRFGDNFDIEISIEPADLQKLIPPLAIQMLLENCFNHNIVSNNKPLHIRVFSRDNSITVENNLQKKQHPESTGQGLKNIEGRYRFAGADAVKIESDEQRFAVTIPLLTPN